MLNTSDQLNLSCGDVDLLNSNPDVRKSKKAVFRRTIDYNASTINYFRDRIWISRDYQRPTLQPDYLWSPNWTPEGRRLITGAFSGEFTLWNGLTFNFETILQAHESQIRCMKWSHNEEWLLTADHSGYIKYWQANMNNVEMYQAHKEPIRGVSFCPFDSKFVTCSDDSTVRIWDFHRCAEERVLRGHGSDVRSVAWHPVLSLIISGSKDAQQPIKLWDPKTGESVTTLYVHKNTCTDVAWNNNGNWFLTASRDHLIKLFDLRNLKSELQTFRGHKRDVMRVAWHPFYECLFASGSADGAIFYWLAGTDTELGAVDNAHESMIWSLAWHPYGHILVSGANDFATKFWTRNRPGDVLKDLAGTSTSDGMMQTAGENEYTENLFTADLLKRLNETKSTCTLLDDHDEVALTTNPFDTSTMEIPGLNEGPVADLNVIHTDLDDREKNRLRNTRTIPKEFALNWASTRITAMPTVMVPTPPQPSPSAIAAAAAAACAAVSNLNSTPQYLPPVKPTLSAASKDRTKSQSDETMDLPAADVVAAMSCEESRLSTNVMNLIGQPESMGPIGVEHLVQPNNAYLDNKINNSTMNDFQRMQQQPVNSQNYRNVREKPLPSQPPLRNKHPMDMHREPFDHLSYQGGGNVEPLQRNPIDHDYREYGHPLAESFGGRQYPPNEYYNGDGLHRDRRPREMPYNDHLVPPNETPPPPHYDRRMVERCHPPRPHDHDNRHRGGWSENDRYAYDQHPRFLPPNQRRPPFDYPPEPRPPGNYIPPGKRPLPPDNYPPGKSRNKWGGGYDRW